MISFNWLGRLGRLGNQMFQYAALLGIARRRGYELCIPPPDPPGQPSVYQLWEAFQLTAPARLGLQEDAPRVQASFAFDPELARGCPDGVDLFGFFQSERWFEDQADQVRAEFAFRPDVAAAAQAALAAIGPEVIALHVRRGDYLRQSHVHPPCQVDYYRRALKRLPGGLPVLVFSDDLDWCKAQDLFRRPRIQFSEGRSNIEDLCLMSLCRHHVIANSSFSWWGAWLAGREGQVVIAPARWFGEPGFAGAQDTEDLTPGRWERV